ncbi:oligoendopeptidase F [bacterium]|nr:oligoendopeptidase F [bacterium]
MHYRNIFIATLLLLVALCTSVFAVERAEIDDKYKWKPEHIYASVKDWEADMDGIRADMEKLPSFKGTFAGDKAINPPKSLIAMSKLVESIMGRLERAWTYAMFNFNVDMGNSEWGGRMQQLQFLSTDLSQNTAWVEPELLKIPQETMHKYISENPELENYRKTYDDMYLLQEHVLSEPEEEILALAGNITGTASDVYRNLTDVDLDFGYILDENGDSVEVTDAGWVSWRTSSDRRVREDYFKAVWNKYKRYRTSISALMAGNINRNVFLTKARKYDNTLQRALSYTFVPEDVYINLVETTRKNTAPLHKYNEIRKRILGLDHYRHWDYYVSLIDAEEPRYTWEESVKMVLDALKPLGSEYVGDLARGLDPGSGWVDVYASAGKRGGAYSSSCYQIHPYMLYNFDYDKGLTLEDASTIAHEGGHSMHTFYSEKNQPYPNKDYVIFNAEVASTVNEALMSMKLLDEARAAYKKAKGKDKEAAKNHLVYLLEQNINSARGTFYRQTMFAAWEWEANKLGEQSQPMTSESFNAIYEELLKEFHGPAAEYEDLSNYSWSRIPHYYRGYYVYTYATSYAASIALATDIRAEAKGDKSKKGTTERYLKYLKSGSAKHPVELLADAGVDMTTPAPIESFIDYFTDLVDEMDKLTQ